MADNLPVALTSFVGREAELGELRRAISTRRLVTLTGVGGAGKTRLAMETAGQVAEAWPDGIWLVDLGAVTDPAGVPRLTAATVGVLVEPEGNQVQTLAAQLRNRRMLLCLDTCEHLLAAVGAFVDALLRNCPNVSVLATSREPLGVAGETVWRVPSLKPDEAVQLFADRAGLVHPGFDVNAALPEVRAVCGRVDHIPLAIELAAAWVRALSPAQIAAGLEDRFRLLTGGPRGAVPRHRTLLASMAWSHGLLEDEERVLFRRLAVFSGTFTLDAVASVCDSSGLDTLQLVGRLLDKSLMTVRESPRELRYRLLDTIRQYAEDQLHAAGEVEEVRDRHLGYFLGLAEAGVPGLDTDQDTWRQELDSHHDNFHAALQWGLAASAQSPVERGERGRRLAASLARQWFIRGQSAEGLEFLRRAIDLAPTDRSPVQAGLWAGVAMLGITSGRLDLVAEAAERGLEIATEAGDDVARARCLAMAAYPVFYADFSRCQALAAQARTAGEAAGDPFSRDWAAVMEGYSLQTRNRHEEAVAIARLAYERSWPRRDRFCAGFARGIEVFPAMVSGDVRGAAAMGEELVRIVAPLGDYFAAGTITMHAALPTAMSGDLAGARAMMEPVIRLLGTDREADVVGFMVYYGLLHLWEGDLEEAVRWLETGVQRMSGGTRDWQAGRCYPGLVGALRRLGRTDEALEHAAEAVSVETEFGAPYELSNVLDEQARLLRGTDPARSRDLLHESLALRRAHGLRTCYADSLDALAELAAGDGDHASAVRLLASSTAGREQMGYPRPPVDLPDYEALLSSLRSALGEEEFDAQWAAGTARPIDDAVAVVTRGRGPRNRPEAGWPSLTPTELDVVRLVSQGLANPEIAARLYVSRSTVKAHLSHIYAKLGVANRTELATLAGTRPEPE